VIVYGTLCSELTFENPCVSTTRAVVKVEFVIILGHNELQSARTRDLFAAGEARASCRELEGGDGGVSVKAVEMGHEVRAILTSVRTGVVCCSVL